MPQIGEFTRETSGFSGRIRCAVLDLEVSLVELAPGDIENAPDFRVHRGDADGPEIGAAWKRSGDKAGEYLSVVIDDPTFAQPIRANLFRSGQTSTWHLQWSRPTKRAEKA